jgi:hypothetical protein
MNPKSVDSLPARVVWDVEEETVESVVEFDALLERLSRLAQATEPFLVEVVARDGSAMAIGLGRPTTVLSYMAASHDPPYFASLGTTSMRSGQLLRYRMGGEIVEFPATQEVDLDRGIAALRQFLEDGTKSELIGWREV